MMLDGPLLGHVERGCAARVAALGIDNAELELKMFTTGMFVLPLTRFIPLSEAAVRPARPQVDIAALDRQMEAGRLHPAIRPGPASVFYRPGCGWRRRWWRQRH